MNWRKSSRSIGNGQCIEVAWRKSRRCGNSFACVETATTDGAVLVRDSKHPGTAALAFTPGEWQRFTGDLKAGLA